MSKLYPSCGRCTLEFFPDFAVMHKVAINILVTVFGDMFLFLLNIDPGWKVLDHGFIDVNL